MKVVALAGGVGGAKLADGLAHLLPPENLTILVNTGDDFNHLGLYISPDLDTVCYTLAGMVNSKTGWGRVDESFHVLENLNKLGGPNWFQLGDQDLATHIERTRRLGENQSLSQITREFCRIWGVKHPILPMSDQPVRTIVDTVEHGEIAFQEYFVHQKCTPRVKGFRFMGSENARPSPGVLEAVELADAVVICPSNPWVSIDPILAIKDIRIALSDKMVVAVSPIIGGRTVKGPAAKMYEELGIQPSALAIVNHYKGILAGFVLDSMDRHLAQNIDIPIIITNILMKNADDRQRLAQDVLNLIQTL